jgi:uncharacterized protein YlxW (UPF0749 family)
MDGFDSKKMVIIDAIIEDNKKIDGMMEEIHSVEEKYKQLEEEVTKTQAAIEKLTSNNDNTAKEIKSDIVDFINDGLQQIEEKVGSVVETTLNTYGKSILTQLRSLARTSNQ